MIFENVLNRAGNKVKRYIAMGMAVVVTASTVLFANVVFGGSQDVKTIELGVAQYFGIIAEQSVTNGVNGNGNHCPSNVLTKDLTSGTIGYDRGGEDMLGDTYGQGIGVMYITGTLDFKGGEIFASKLYLNSNYSSYVTNGNERYVENSVSGTSVKVGTGSQCRAFYNIGTSSDTTGINLENIFASLKRLSASLANKEDKGVSIVNSGNDQIRLTSNYENVITIDKNWSGKTLWISDQNFKATNSTLLVNVDLDNAVTENFNLNQVKAGYSAYDNTDALVFNFGDFDGTIYLTETAGTIIAPYADIVLLSGDHHGRLIGQNITVGAEVHFIPSFYIPEEEETTTTTEGDTTTTEEDTTTTEEDTTTTEEDTTTTEDDTTTTEEDTTTTEEDTTTTEEDTTTTEEDTTTTEGDTITTEEDTTTTEGDTTTTEEDTTTTEEDATTTVERETTTDSETVTLETESIPQDKETTTDNDKSETEDNTTDPESETTTDETIVIETETIPLNKETTVDPGEEIVVIEDEIPLGNSTPKTGDSNTTMVWVIIAVAALGAAGYTGVRELKNKEK